MVLQLVHIGTKEHSSVWYSNLYTLERRSIAQYGTPTCTHWNVEV